MWSMTFNRESVVPNAGGRKGKGGNTGTGPRPRSRTSKESSTFSGLPPARLVTVLKYIDMCATAAPRVPDGELTLACALTHHTTIAPSCNPVHLDITNDGTSLFNVSLAQARGTEHVEHLLDLGSPYVTCAVRVASSRQIVFNLHRRRLTTL